MGQVVINSIITAGIYLLIALSFTVIYSTIRFFHLAHGAIYTAGAYIAYASVVVFLDRDLRIGFNNVVPLYVYIIAVFIAIIASAFIGGAIDRLIYRPLRQKKASALTSLLTSFGLLISIQNLIALLYGSQILTLRTGPIKEGLVIIGVIITPIQILIIVSALLLFVFISIITVFTKVGKAMRAVSNDSITASIVGINPEKIILFAFLIGSALAGLSGVLISLETNLEPTMGFNLLLKGIIACIIGGIGSLNGVLLGSLFLGLVENLTVWYFPSGWKDAIVFGIFLIFLISKPQGILGKKDN